MSTLNDLQNMIKTFTQFEPDIIHIQGQLSIQTTWFDPKPWEIYKAPGVYVIVGSQSDILYVGESADPPRRVTQHLGVAGPTAETCERDWLGRIPTSIVIFKVSNQHEAKLLERYLILKLNPPFNKE